MVEKREFAGKKAKLAAAELGKLSKRVFGEQYTLTSSREVAPLLHLANPFNFFFFFNLFQTVQQGILLRHILQPR